MIGEVDTRPDHGSTPMPADNTQHLSPPPAAEPSTPAAAPSPRCDAWTPPATRSPSTPSPAKPASPAPGSTPRHDLRAEIERLRDRHRPRSRTPRSLPIGNAPPTPRCCTACKPPPTASSDSRTRTASSATPWPQRSGTPHRRHPRPTTRPRHARDPHHPKMIGPADEGRTRHVDYTVHQAYLQLKSLIKSAAQDNRRQVGQRAVDQVGDDLLDDGVVAVVGLGRQHRERAVGEHGVVAPGRDRARSARP